MKFQIDEYRALIADFYKLMRKHRKIASVALNADSWTLQEMVGHLIDSASNNHQRFIRLQLSVCLVLPAYDAEEWKKVSKAGTMDYRFLTDFWKRYNEFLLLLIERLDPSSLANVWETDKGDITLESLVGDYFGHIRWHLALFERRAAEIRAV